MVGSIFGATGGTFWPRNDKAYVLLSAGWMKGSQWIEWSYCYAFETQWNILLTCLTPCLWFPSPWKKHRQPKKTFFTTGPHYWKLMFSQNIIRKHRESTTPQVVLAIWACAGANAPISSSWVTLHHVSGALANASQDFVPRMVPLMPWENGGNIPNQRRVVSNDCEFCDTHGEFFIDMEYLYIY